MRESVSARPETGWLEQADMARWSKYGDTGSVDRIVDRASPAPRWDHQTAVGMCPAGGGAEAWEAIYVDGGDHQEIATTDLLVEHQNSGYLQRTLGVVRLC